MAIEQEQKRTAAKQRLMAHIKTSRQRLNNKTANLRRIAAEEPHELGNALEELSRLFSDVAEVFRGLAGDTTALKENLDLAEPGKTASIKARVQARRNYARTLRRIATETPEELGTALSEVYHELDGAVAGIEGMAQRFGLPLDEPTEDLGDESVEGESTLPAPAESAPIA